ncbi:MAG: T9SS type A sorting domain-containing protein [Candidatus Marinimicrobia bacterium]|jgi:hypothetical protein|nr:T9SS type A sorting domain-containing protein [Candidatus Neomarinimicrobiota bacterium]
MFHDTGTLEVNYEQLNNQQNTNIYINAGESLDIFDESEISFANNSGIEVFGELNVEGTRFNFNTGGIDVHGGMLNFDNTNVNTIGYGLWKGINISDSDGSILSNSTISHAMYSALTIVNSSNIVFTNLILENNYSDNGFLPSPLVGLTPEEIQQLSIYEIFSNRTDYADLGGGVAIISSNVACDNLLVQDNYAALLGGGTLIYESTVNFENCIIKDNESGMHGGGIVIYDSDVTFDHSAILSNDAAFSGGALGASYSNIDLINCTIANNSSISNDIDVDLNVSVDIINTIFFNESILLNPSTYTLRYSDLFNSTINVIPDNSNITSDPDFVDETSFNYNLLSTSQCIDTGDPDPDFYDQDGTISDMGAYYFYQHRGDVTYDFSVDVLDVVAIVAHILGTSIFIENQFRNGDVNIDELIDVADIVVIQNCILNSDCDNLERTEFKTASGNAMINFSYSEKLARSNGEESIISINSEVPIGGFQMTIGYDPAEIEFSSIEKLEASVGLTLEYNASIPGIIVLVLYPEDFFEIPAGENDIIKLIFNGLGRSYGKEIKLTKINSVLADPIGNKLNIVTSNEVPSEIILYPTFPNPFNPVANLSYSIPENGVVTLVIYDMLGREVVQLVDSYILAGHHSVKWDASTFASGVYLVKLTASKFTLKQKVVLVK